MASREDRWTTKQAEGTHVTRWLTRAVTRASSKRDEGVGWRSNEITFLGVPRMCLEHVTWTNTPFVGDRHEMGRVFANDKRERTMTHLMQPRLDQYAKNLLRDALSLASILPETEVEVLAATQKIDVYATPDPAREKERQELGLLGDLSSVASMFEAFSDTPNLQRTRRCLSKQLAWHHELRRRARVVAGENKEQREEETDNEPIEKVPFPRLIVVSPGRPNTVLSLFGATNVRPGVYWLVEGLCTCVIVAAELPETRETLLLRLMGEKKVRDKAIAALMALPRDAVERNIAMPLVLHFRIDLELFAEKDGEPMSAEIRAWHENYENNLRNEGFNKGERALLVRLLRVRFGEVPSSIIARVDAADTPLLEKWGERVISAKSLADVFDGTN